MLVNYSSMIQPPQDISSGSGLAITHQTPDTAIAGDLYNSSETKVMHRVVKIILTKKDYPGM